MPLKPIAPSPDSSNDLLVGMGDARGHGVPHARTKAPVGTRVEPAPGLVGLDELAGVGHEVTAVADHHRVAVEAPPQLAVDPRRVDRVGVGLQFGALGLAA